MRKAIKTVGKYMHTVLVLAIIVPVIYAMALRADDYAGNRLYALCLLIVPPVLITGVAVKKCRSLFFYLLMSVAGMAVTMEFAVFWGKAVLGGLVWGYVFFLGAEIFWVILECYLQRASIDKNRNDGGSYSPDWKPREGIFEKPRTGVLIVFVLAYLIGLGFANPPLCTQALGSAIVYLFTVVLYRYVENTEAYLSLHKRVHGLPSKRIYGISGGMLAVFLCLVFLLSAAALASGSLRHYTDVRDLEFLADLEFEPYLPQENVQNDGGEMDMMEQLEMEYGETEPLPVWVERLFQAVEAVILLGVFVGALRAVYGIFQRFRENYEENGDIVEELREDSDAVETIPKVKKGIRFRSRREQVRYEYRRFIRKHRKGKPGVYETPLEIETLANVADSAEGKEMHWLYEKVRYGKEEIE